MIRLQRPRRAVRAALTATMAAALTVCAGALAGCGFTPLYAAPGVTPALSSVEVEVPQSRTAYLLKQKLNEELDRDADTPARYRLAITLSDVRAPLGIRVNNVASRYEVALTPTFVLSDAVTGKVLLQAAAPVVVSYDSSDPPYAGVIANQNGEERAAEQAAIAIRLRLSRYFDQLANTK